MPLPTCRPRTGARRITTTPTPKPPTASTPRAAAFSHATPFNPAAFGIAPNSLEATDTAQLLGLGRGAASRSPTRATAKTAPFDRSRVSVILGVTGTLELVIPLGARLGHPIWRRALREAGVAENVADDVVRAHRRFLRRLAGKLLSRAARQRGGRPHRQSLRSGRHQLRRRCRLRLVAQRLAPGLPGTDGGPGRHGADRRRRYVQ